jgi:hypothetical protein
VLSRPDLYPKLADHFVSVMFDFYQGQHYKAKVGVHLGTGDQLFLDPQGNAIPTGRTGKDGRPTVVYGRHGLDTTPEVLDSILAKHPPKAGPPALRLEWFLFPDKYPWPNPATVAAVAQYARMPMATIEGPMPAPLEDAAFLRWHVRQFLWVRGKADGPSRIVVRRVRDGLPEGTPTDLGAVDGTLGAAELGKALDEKWRAYMKERPFTARGYHENPHGKWMRSVKDQMIGEDESIRRQALAGTLAAPGRKPGERPPYLP